MLSPGTSHVGHAAKNMLRRKNGAQQKTNVKNTTPNTLVAFCSVITALADSVFLFPLFAKNLEKIIYVK